MLEHGPTDRFDSANSRRTCFFLGHVQGVGFRYTVQSLAAGFDVKGYVRNMPDGRVELVMEGPGGQMRELLERIRDELGGYIQDVTVEESAATGEFQHFSIKH